ncbi:MAG: CDP-glucose 4,6-dehydratase [Candidatus Omnitrophica bacterium]|nr:CDP-glucose 4,6-dehydratase [Candidatus Omnitrophota bacterium]
MDDRTDRQQPPPKPFGDFYRGKVVFVTGHSGFKGSWLATWLTELGAQVVGYALEPPTKPSVFEACRLAERITHLQADIRDFDRLQSSLQQYRPQIVFHLAAQSLVRRSFAEPHLTFETNLMGTVNVLEAIRAVDSVQAAVLITSDKCYQNVGWPWGYRETDTLGGYDAYSASKACAELAIAAYQDARFQQSVVPPRDLALASARAGNVIGGGDWALHRIVPDSIRAIVERRDLIIRHPDATRPWQHVLEPVSGYLWLAALLATKEAPYRTSWNFGPTEDRPVTVQALVKTILATWPAPSTRLVVERDPSEAESILLRLDCSKAFHHLHWRSTWTIERTLEATVEWYRHFYAQPHADHYPWTIQQIATFVQEAREQAIAWAQPQEALEGAAT